MEAVMKTKIEVVANVIVILLAVVIGSVFLKDGSLPLLRSRARSKQVTGFPASRVGTGAHMIGPLC